MAAKWYGVGYALASLAVVAVATHSPSTGKAEVASAGSTTATAAAACTTDSVRSGGGATASAAPEASCVQADAKTIPQVGNPGTKNERSFIALKPDAVQRGLIGKIIARFEEKGFKLVAMKFLQPTLDQAKGHYDDLKATKFFAGLTAFFSSGPIVAMVWEGEGVIAGARKMMGATKPAESNPGTIRGDFCVNVGRNIIHGSDSAASAAKEIAFWFKPEEVITHTPTVTQHIYE